jgi:hypothetical protein
MHLFATYIILMFRRISVVGITFKDLWVGL